MNFSHSLGNKKQDAELAKFRSSLRHKICQLMPSTVERVLLVGVGDGLLAKEIKIKHPNATIYSIEVDFQAAKLALQLLDDVWLLDPGNLKALDIGCVLDLVVCEEGIGGFHGAIRVLDAIRERTSQNGTLIISVPNPRHWQKLFLLLKHDHSIDASSGASLSSAVHMPSLSEMLNALKENGWLPE